MSRHCPPFKTWVTVAAAGLIAAVLSAPGMAKPDKDKHDNAQRGRTAGVRQVRRGPDVRGQGQSRIGAPGGSQWHGRAPQGRSVREPSRQDFRPTTQARGATNWSPRASGTSRGQERTWTAPRRDTAPRPPLFGQRPAPETPNKVTRPASPQRVTSRWAESPKGRGRDENVRTTSRTDKTFRPMLFGQKPARDDSKQITRPARSERGLLGQTGKATDNAQRTASAGDKPRGFLQKPATPRETASPGRVDKQDRQVSRPQGQTSGGASHRTVRSERVTSR